jgi:hypothetical protein
MSAPKLTEAQRDRDALAGIDTGEARRVDAFVLMTLKGRGLIIWSSKNPRGPGRWILTDTGRAALRGES